MTAPDPRDSVELLPCPGCGDTRTRVIGGPGTRGGPEYWAGCDCCRWRTWGNTEAEAIEAWNRRALPQQAGEEDAEIREILFGALDRDRDNITTRNLVVVAVNALQRERERAEAAEAALREAQANDRRYRWLRDCDVDGEDAVMVRGEKGRHTDELLSGTSLDAAIDAAIGGAGAPPA